LNCLATCVGGQFYKLFLYSLGIFPCASLILTWFLALNVLGSMHVLDDFGSSLIDSLGLLGLAMGLVGVRIIQTCVPNP